MKDLKLFENQSAIKIIWNFEIWKLDFLKLFEIWNFENNLRIEVVKIIWKLEFWKIKFEIWNFEELFENESFKN